MCNPDILINKMTEDDSLAYIIIASLMSSDNDPETLPERLDAAKKLKSKAEENKRIASDNGDINIVDKLEALTMRLDDCIRIIMGDLEA